MEDDRLQQALDVTYKVLSKDILWEPAYMLQMEIFHRMGRHSMVHSVFNHCKQTLEVKNNIPLSSDLTKCYEELTMDEKKPINPS